MSDTAASSADLLTALRTDLCNDLRAKADPKHRDGLRGFFKEAVNPLGVRARDMNAIVARHWRKAKTLAPAELFALCDQLWDSGVFEEPLVACKWCARALPLLDAAPAFATFERWLATRVDNWALCDDLSTHCIGGLLPAYPALLERTLPWMTSPNRWLRRASAVCCVLPARHGLFVGHAFRVAHVLMKDEDDLVRKGYGWLLKECSRVWPREVLEFVLHRRAEMPRVALRYAIELLPPDWKRQAMVRVS